jgi:hypothetical protein
MANLSLRVRRNNARGISAYVGRAWANRKFSGIGNRATLTTALAGANNDLFYMAKVPGTGGNAITVTYVVAGASTALSVSVSVKAITVNLATSAGSASISTADDVAKAVRANAAASALVHVNRAPANDGTGVVVAMGAASLAGAV